MRKSPTESPALWAQVQATLRERIRNGSYPVGAFMPREVDLAQELGVSRNTVREATRRLAEEGLLNRRKRAGTRVISTGLTPELSLNLDPQIALRSLGQSWTMKQINQGKARLPDEMSSLWSGASHDEWATIEYLRVSPQDEHPLSWAQIYLPPDLEDLIALADRPARQFLRLLEERRQERMFRTKTQLLPTMLGPRVAGLLGMSPDDLALKVSHALLNEHGACREVVVSLYPARHYSFEISFNLREHAQAEE